MSLTRPNTKLLGEVGSTVFDKIGILSGLQLTVKDYGAKGDWNGTTGTDDSDAIQAAINAAGSNHEVVFPKGKYYVTKTITFKDHSKIRFNGAEIITNQSFTGSAVFQCNSAWADGLGSGYWLNPKFTSVDQRTNAVAIQMDYCKNFRMSNLVTTGYIKGGLVQLTGYELFLNGFNILAPTDLTTRSYPSLQPGIDLQTTDLEISNGAVVGYPVGVKTGSSNNFINIHCWGLPSTGNVNDKQVMLYPFMITGQLNQFVNCTADTMDLLDTTGSAGLSNGGIGFYEAEYSLTPVFPWKNKYITCRIIKHASSVNGKLIGFRFGDTHASSTVNGMNTMVISPSFNDNSSNLLKNIKIDSSKAKTSSIILGGRLLDNQVTTNQVNILRSDATVGASKIYKIVTLGTTAAQLFTEAEIKNFCIEKITPATSSSGSIVGVSASVPGKVAMTSDGTIYDTTNFVNAHTTVSTQYQIGTFKWYGNTAGTPIKVYRDGTNWYAVCPDNINIPFVLDITAVLA